MKTVKTILSFRAIQNQTAGWIQPTSGLQVKNKDCIPSPPVFSRGHTYLSISYVEEGSLG